MTVLQRSGSLVEEVYRQLKQRILSAQLKPGTPLQEVALAEELGTSRTPVREALRVLEQEGLVQITSGRGAQVAELSIRDVVEAYEVRCLLEPFLAKRAAARITTEQIQQLEDLLVEQVGDPNTHDEFAQVARVDVAFHDIILKASAHGLMQTVVSQARTRTQRAAYFVNQSRYAQSREEHLAILQAFKAADGDLAEHLMYLHIQSAMQRFVRDQIGFLPS